MASRSRKKHPELETNCPIPNAHRRLLSAHRLWHEALKEYADPEGFRTKLNATIQELRNVTFVLQKEHRAIPRFEEWYAEQQAALKADELCRWVVDARNRIVKQGDLITSSRARVSIVLDYNEPPTEEFDAAPLTSTKDIAASFVVTAPPAIRRDGAVVVERRWVAEDLREHELLAALAHVFGSLSRVVGEAHRLVDVPFSVVRCSGTTQDPERLPPSCMAAGKAQRTVVMGLEDASIRRTRQRLIRGPSSKKAKSLIKRYGQPSLGAALIEAKGDLKATARALHQAGKQVLAVDGHHAHFVHLLKGGKAADIRLVAARDQVDKQLIWLEMARDIQEMGADALVSTSEFWWAPFDPAYPQRRASESPERKEGLQTAMISAKGDRFVISTLFERKDGQVVLGDSNESDDNRLYFLDPVLRVWALTQR